MTYLIEASTFSGGYSIFRLEVIDGERVKRYLTDARTLAEARALCPGASEILIPEEINRRVETRSKRISYGRPRQFLDSPS